MTPLPLLRLALPVSFAMLLAGCASTLATQVTSFHQLSNGLQGQRFVLMPTEEQKSSLEFNTYADLVRKALLKKGLVDAGGSNGAAELGVTMEYSVSGRGSAMRDGTSGYAGFGAGSGGFSFGSVGVGIGFPIGSIGGGAAESIAYQRTLQIRIDRLRAAAVNPASGASGASTARVFEARAISEGPSASIAPVIAAMVQAVFEEFPGPSGQTRVVRMPLDEGQ